MGFWTILEYISYIGAVVIATLQAIFSAFLLLIVAIFVFYFQGARDSIKEHTVILDTFTGANVSGQLTVMTDFLKFILLAIFITYFVICVLLCKGLCERKAWMILLYVICGACLLGVRARLITSYEIHNFLEDKSVMYCIGYGCYLLSLFMFSVEIIKEKKDERDWEKTTVAARVKSDV